MPRCSLFTIVLRPVALAPSGRALGKGPFRVLSAGARVSPPSRACSVIHLLILDMCKGPQKDGCRLPKQTSPSSESDDELDSRIVEALECPCVADLKAGPCGELFVSCFTCFTKSKAEPKGCDCLDVSLAFADCLRQHPEVLDDLHKADDLEKQSGLALPSAGR